MDDILGQTPIQQALPPIPLTPEETTPGTLGPDIGPSGVRHLA